MVTAAGDTSSSVGQGSGLNISELKGSVGVGRFRKRKGLQAPTQPELGLGCQGPAFSFYWNRAELLERGSQS